MATPDRRTDHGPPPVSVVGVGLRAALVGACAAQVPVTQMARLDRSPLERRSGWLVAWLPEMKGVALPRTVELGGHRRATVPGIEAALAASDTRRPLANPSLRSWLQVVAAQAGARLGEHARPPGYPLW